MKKSPTDVSPNEPGSGRTNQYRLSALFTITALVAFVLGMERWLGAAGAGVTVYLIVGGLMLAQFLSIPYIFGLKVPNCSFPEWLTILLIVTMMTGLFLPAVNSSHFHRARPAPVPQTTAPIE